MNCGADAGWTSQRARFDAVATLVEPSAGALYDSLERLRALPGVTRIEAWLHLAVLKEDYTRTLRPLRTD